MNLFETIKNRQTQRKDEQAMDFMIKQFDLANSNATISELIQTSEYFAKYLHPLNIKEFDSIVTHRSKMENRDFKEVKTEMRSQFQMSIHYIHQLLQNKIYNANALDIIIPKVNSDANQTEIKFEDTKQDVKKEEKQDIKQGPGPKVSENKTETTEDKEEIKNSKPFKSQISESFLNILQALKSRLKIEFSKDEIDILKLMQNEKIAFNKGAKSEIYPKCEQILSQAYPNNLAFQPNKNQSNYIISYCQALSAEVGKAAKQFNYSNKREYLDTLFKLGNEKTNVFQQKEEDKQAKQEDTNITENQSIQDPKKQETTAATATEPVKTADTKDVASSENKKETSNSEKKKVDMNKKVSPKEHNVIKAEVLSEQLKGKSDNYYQDILKDCKLPEKAIDKILAAHSKNPSADILYKAALDNLRRQKNEYINEKLGIKSDNKDKDWEEHASKDAKVENLPTPEENNNENQHVDQKQSMFEAEKKTKEILKKYGVTDEGIKKLEEKKELVQTAKELQSDINLLKNDHHYSEEEVKDLVYTGRLHLVLAYIKESTVDKAKDYLKDDGISEEIIKGWEKEGKLIKAASDIFVYKETLKPEEEKETANNTKTKTETAREQESQQTEDNSNIEIPDSTVQGLTREAVLNPDNWKNENGKLIEPKISNEEQRKMKKKDVYMPFALLDPELNNADAYMTSLLEHRIRTKGYDHKKNNVWKKMVSTGEITGSLKKQYESIIKEEKRFVNEFINSKEFETFREEYLKVDSDLSKAKEVIKKAS